MKVETKCRVPKVYQEGAGGFGGYDAFMPPRPHHKHCIDGETEAREKLDWSFWSCPVRWV